MRTSAMYDLGPAPLRVLLHSIDGGLGHLSRLIAVAERLRALATVPILPLFLCETDTRLLDAYDLKYLPIGDRDKAARQGWPYLVPALDELLVAAVEAVVQKWKPSAVIHDTHVWEPLVRAASESGARQIAIVRSMPEAPRFLLWQAHTLNQMNLVLFPHEAPVSTPDAAMTLSTSFEYVGEICRPSPIARSSCLGPLSGTRILITGGGGGIISTQTFIADVSAVLSELALPQLEVTFVPGPLFSGEVVFSGTATVRVLSFVDDMRSLASQHHLVICQGGYNTLAELRSINRYVVCMPQNLDWDDQLGRVRGIVAENRRFRMARSRDQLRSCLKDLMSLRDFGCMPEPQSVESEGASRAARSILKVIGIEVDDSDCLL